MSEQKYFMVKNARCSFPDLFSRAVVDGKEGSYGITLLLDKEEHASIIKEIEKEINSLIKTKLKGAKIPSDKRCLKDGDDTTRVEYEGYIVINANSKNKPHVLKPNTQDIAQTGEESKIYSGCFVDAKISLWAQDNNYGKRINAQLAAVRFYDDGEAFSAGHISEDEAADGFDVTDGDDFFDEIDEAA